MFFAGTNWDKSRQPTLKMERVRILHSDFFPSSNFWPHGPNTPDLYLHSFQGHGQKSFQEAPARLGAVHEIWYRE